MLGLLRGCGIWTFLEEGRDLKDRGLGGCGEGFESEKCVWG